MTTKTNTTAKISVIATLGGALLTAALSLATPAYAAGAGGHDRPRSFPQPTTSTVVPDAGTGLDGLVGSQGQ